MPRMALYAEPVHTRYEHGSGYSARVILQCECGWRWVSADSAWFEELQTQVEAHQQEAHRD